MAKIEKHVVTPYIRRTKDNRQFVVRGHGRLMATPKKATPAQLSVLGHVRKASPDGVYYIHDWKTNRSVAACMRAGWLKVVEKKNEQHPLLQLTPQGFAQLSGD